MSLSVAPAELSSWLTDFQRLAIGAGLAEDELRVLLRRLVAERLAEEARGRRASRSCVRRVARDFETTDRSVLRGTRECHECRFPKDATPGPRDYRWVETLEESTRETALARLAALR